MLRCLFIVSTADIDIIVSVASFCQRNYWLLMHVDYKLLHLISITFIHFDIDFFHECDCRVCVCDCGLFVGF